jgi:hypothetical protein
MTWQVVYQHFLLSSPHSAVHSEVAKAGRLSAPKFWERFEMHDVAEQLAGSGHMCMVGDILFCAYRIGRCVDCEAVDEELERGASKKWQTL